MILRLFLPAAVSAALVVPGLAQDAPLDTLPERDRMEWMASAVAEGRSGTAKKTAPVDARPAVAGEIIVTRIAGQGIETRSPPPRATGWCATAARAAATRRS
jgi:hypothetical protein